MTKRQTIQSFVKKLNEGATDSGRLINEMFGNECAEEYQKMMKALNTIKTLKIEISNYTQEGVNTSSQEEEKREGDHLMPLLLSRSYSAISSPEEDQVHENCFSCI